MKDTNAAQKVAPMNRRLMLASIAMLGGIALLSKEGTSAPATAPSAPAPDPENPFEQRDLLTAVNYQEFLLVNHLRFLRGEWAAPAETPTTYAEDDLLHWLRTGHRPPVPFSTTEQIAKGYNDGLTEDDMAEERDAYEVAMAPLIALARQLGHQIEGVEGKGNGGK